MINLTTPSKDLINELFDEKPKALYWHEKQTGSKSKKRDLQERYDKHSEELGKRFIGYATEYKSQRGNRWYVFDIVNVSENAFHIVTVSFVYYETYESIGCFMPSMQGGLGTGQPEHGVDIFTSHFFKRYCERMGIPFRSRQMIEEFAQNILYMTATEEQDKDGEEQEVYRIPHQGIVKARRRKDCPLVLEMRTFIADKQLSPTKAKRYAEMAEMADSKWYEAGTLLVKFIRTFTDEKGNNMDIKQEMMPAGYNDRQAWQVMQLLVNAVSDYPETEIKTLLKGTTLAMAALTSAYEKANSITDDSLRREVMQWVKDKDFGIGLKADVVNEDMSETKRQSV